MHWQISHWISTHPYPGINLVEIPLWTVGAQWLSGRESDSRLMGRRFEPHRRHCVVSFSRNINPSLVLVQPRKTCPFITEKLLMGRKESNQTKKQLTTVSLCKCLPSHLWWPWPTLSFYLHVTNCLNCSTGLFNLSKPTKPFFSQDKCNSKFSFGEVYCLIYGRKSFT